MSTEVSNTRPASQYMSGTELPAAPLTESAVAITGSVKAVETSGAGQFPGTVTFITGFGSGGSRMFVTEIETSPNAPLGRILNVDGDYLTTADLPGEVVLDTGSYADPAWVTSLDAAKLTGTLNVNRIAAASIDLATKVTGQLPTANLPGAQWVGTQSGQSTLGSTFSITGANDVFQATGLSITLPAAGTYLITGTVRGTATGTAGAYVNCKLRNTTDGADVANSETLILNVAAVANSTGLSILVTVAASKVIELYASRNNGGGSFTVSNISSDSLGRTRLAYSRLY